MDLLSNFLLQSSLYGILKLLSNSQQMSKHMVDLLSYFLL